MFGTPCGRQLILQLLGIEFAVAPGDALVIHFLVGYPVITERRQQTGIDAVEHITTIDQVVVTKRQNVGLIGTFRGSCQTQQKTRPEMVQ